MPFIFATLLFLSAAANAAIHGATVSPSGRYQLASETFSQKEPGGETSPLGAKVSLIGPDRVEISSCYLPGKSAYIEDLHLEGRDNWETKAYWNSDETLVAVYSGGNTWSRLDFYAVQKGQITLLPHPDWHAHLSRIPGFHGATSRLYEGFTQWTTKDCLDMKISGTVQVDESQKERAGDADFSYQITLKIRPEGLELIQVKAEGN